MARGCVNYEGIVMVRNLPACLAGDAPRRYAPSMLRWLISSALLLSACTASDGAIDKVEDARARNDGPAIWVARDDDSTLYLYGTLHIVPIGMDWQREDMWEAFRSAGTVWFEVSSDPTSRTKAERLTRTRGFLPIGERLSEGWSDYERKTLEVASVSSGLPLEFLDTLEPWLAADLITLAAAEAAGLSAEISADEALKSRARRQSKYVRYLEDVSEQIALSTDIPKDAQVENLLAVLERYNRIGDELNAIASEWVEGDVEGLTERLETSVAGPDRERLYTLRNGNWADVFEGWMEGSGTGFAAVGVGHLVGEGSLVEQLRDRGLEVRRYYAFEGENVLRTIDLEVERNRADAPPEDVN